MNGTIVQARPVGPRGRLLQIEVDPATAAGFTDCGQYCALDLAGETGFFAIARAPGPGPLEFYVQDGGGVSTRLLGAAIGTPVTVSMPAGAGFGLAGLSPQTPLIVVATGSGIGAVRGVLQSSPVSAIYVGFRTPADVLFADELQAAAASGTRVVLALSREGRAPVGFETFSGYVQHALEASELDLRDHALVACGQGEMQQACQAVAESLGLAPGRFLTNY